jgi:hypothetical protein
VQTSDEETAAEPAAETPKEPEAPLDPQARKKKKEKEGDSAVACLVFKCICC